MFDLNNMTHLTDTNTFYGPLTVLINCIVLGLLMDARGVKGITIAIVVAVLVMPFIYHKHLKCNMSAIVNQVVSCSSSFKDSMS